MARLQQELPPPPSGGDTVDWDDVYEQSGLRFPMHYRDFVSVYGGGTGVQRGRWRCLLGAPE
jgi:hypothetical protein